MFRKKSQFVALAFAQRRLRRHVDGLALRLRSCLLAGQTSTQSPQPVQSSAATCSVYFCSLNSLPVRRQRI